MNILDLFFNQDVLLNIIDCLPFDDIIKLRYFIKNINDIVYWKSIEHKKILLSNTFLLKNHFKWIIEHDALKDFYYYINKNPNICIAGGYPTLQYLEKKLCNYPNSDIDVYILGDKPKLTFINLLNYLNNICGIIKIVRVGNSGAILNIKVESIDRIIQIIGTVNKHITQVIGQFDASHVKCCYYLGNTYITLDAKYAKDRNMTYFNKNHQVISRLNKAHNLGLQIHGLPNYKILKDQSIKPFRLMINKTKAIKEFKPIKFWYTKYNDIKAQEYYDKLNVNINSMVDFYEHINVNIFDPINIIGFNKKCSSSCEQDILSPKLRVKSGYHYYLNEYRWIKFGFKIKGTLNSYRQERQQYSISTFDVDKVIKLKDILANIYSSYHKKPVPKFKTRGFNKYYDRLNFNDNKKKAYINSVLIGKIDDPTSIVDRNIELIFDIEIELRISFKNNNSYALDFHKEGGGSYGHVYYLIKKINYA